MWNNVKDYFIKRKAGLEIARLMIEYGIRLDRSRRFYVGDVEIPDTSLARAAGVDRRVVRDTADYILQDEQMLSLFEKLKPAGASLVDVATMLGFTVLKVTADPHKLGIISAVSSVLMQHGVIIRQALADDPDLYPEPVLTLVLEGRVPAKAVEELNKLKLVTSLTLMS